jgi:hypothetical protein
MQATDQSTRLSAQKKTGTAGRFGHLQHDAPAFGLGDRIPALKDGEVGQYAAERAWGVITSSNDRLGTLLEKYRAGEKLSADSNESVLYAAGEAARQIHGNRGRHIRVLGADLAHRLIPTAEAWDRGEDPDLEPALNHWADAIDRYIEGQHATTSGKSWDEDEKHNGRLETLLAYGRLIASQEKRRDQKKTSVRSRAIYQRDIDPRCAFIGGRVAMVVGQWSGLDEVELKVHPKAEVCPDCFGRS